MDIVVRSVVEFTILLRYSAFAKDVHAIKDIAADTGRAEAPEGATEGAGAMALGTEGSTTCCFTSRSMERSTSSTERALCHAMCSSLS